MKAIKLYATLVMTIVTTLSTYAVNQPTCVVQDFMGTDDIAINDVQIIQNQFQAAVAQSGKFKLLDHFIAGETQKTISGNISKSGDLFIFVTKISDVESNAIDNEISTEYQGTINGFIMEGIQKNVDQLLDVQDQQPEVMSSESINP